MISRGVRVVLSALIVVVTLWPVSLAMFGWSFFRESEFWLRGAYIITASVLLGAAQMTMAALGGASLAMLWAHRHSHW